METRITRILSEWLSKHPRMAVTVVLVVFFGWTFPSWLGTVWTLFIRDKTLPEWLASHGLTFGMTPAWHLVITGALSVIVIAASMGALSAIRSNQSAQQAEAQRWKTRASNAESHLLKYQQKLETEAAHAEERERWVTTLQERVGECIIAHWGNDHTPRHLRVAVQYSESADRALADSVVKLFPAAAWAAERLDARGKDLRNPSTFARIVIQTANSDIGSALKSAFNDYRLIGERVDLAITTSDELTGWDVVFTIYHAKASAS